MKKEGTTVIFTVPEKNGSLSKALKMFEDAQLTMAHIESRPSKNGKNGSSTDFLVTLDQGEDKAKAAIDKVKDVATAVTVLPRNGHGKAAGAPWFPRTMEELDGIASQVMVGNVELKSDHPGFTDKVYLARRQVFVDIANTCKLGQPLPRMEYTADEVKTWGTVYNHMLSLYPKYACKEFNESFKIIAKDCGYREDNIPQMQDVSAYLQSKTGFQMRPISGFMTPRSFLAGLAFRVFHTCPYMRHPSLPLFTPETDLCHEYLGHAALFADEAYAAFSQEIGLASLGASDEEVAMLGSLYWFTTETGLCRENGEIKAFGAALLSSAGEMQYAMSDKPEKRPFDPIKTSVQSYIVTEFQPLYFVSESFESAKEKVRAFAATLPRPFSVRYNAYTKSMEIIEKKDQIVALTKKARDELSFIENAMKKLEEVN